MACTNQTVRLDGSGSTDADGAVNAFSWNFGDGSSGGGERPTHVFERPGTYTVTLTITGDARGACGALDTDETTVTVVEAPRIEIIGPDRVAAGAAVAFDAALVGDADVRGAAFSWDFGDGATATGPTVEHAFAEPGVRTVTLRAVLPDANEGCGTIETRRLVAVNAPPAPVIEVARPDRGRRARALRRRRLDRPRRRDHRLRLGLRRRRRRPPACRPSTASPSPGPTRSGWRRPTTPASATAASRPIRTVEVSPPPMADLQTPPPLCPGVPHAWTVAEDAADLKASWLFGDGVAVEGPQADHAFEKPGVFPVAVTLDDGGGLDSSRRTEEVYVRVNRAPVAEAGPDRIVCPGDTVAFDAGLSADEDGRLTGWRWRFSDGVVLDGPQVERSFDDAGRPTVQLTVTDDSGSACAAGTDAPRVLVNAPPVVDAGPDRDTPVGAANDTLVFDAGAASDPDGQGVRVEWDFGDGTRAGNAVDAPPLRAPPGNTPCASRRATPPASPAASRATRRWCAPARGSRRLVMRFPLRAKFFVFATLIATAPLALVGQNLVRIARDELKSAANEDLTGVAAGLAADFDTTVEGRWLTPLLVIRNGVDSDAPRRRAEDLAPHPRPVADPRHRRAAAHRRGLGPADPRHRPGLLPAPRRGRARPGRDAAHAPGTPSPPSAATAATASSCPAGSRRPATGSPPSRCRCAPSSPAAA